MVYFKSVPYGSWLSENLNYSFWGIFHGQRFENVDHGAMYSHIFTDTIIICHKNIYQVLKHVCDASFSNMNVDVNITNYHKYMLIYGKLYFFHLWHFGDGLGKAMYHQICTVTTITCYRYVYIRELNVSFCHVYNTSGFKIVETVIWKIL